MCHARDLLLPWDRDYLHLRLLLKPSNQIDLLFIGVKLILEREDGSVGISRFIIWRCSIASASNKLYTYDQSSSSKFSRNIATLILNTSFTSIQLSTHNSRWRPPLSWISKNCCHFITVWQITQKLVEKLRLWFGTYQWRFHSYLLPHHQIECK